jgi:hypothetical protein
VLDDAHQQRRTGRFDGDVSITLVVPAEGGHGTPTVTLGLPDAVSPASIGTSLDDRVLGFGITRLRIE